MINLENVEILGYTGNIENVSKTLEDIEKLKDTCCDRGVIQLLDADGIAGYKHALHGVNQALLAFERGYNLANDLGVELILRISGNRQISKGFKTLGLHEGKMNLCIILIDCPDYFKDELNTMFTPNNKVLESNTTKLLKIYNIPQEELKAICIEDILIDKTTKLITEQ